MKLVQLYLLTSVIVRNFVVSASDSGYLASDELEYLSKRLYPAECSYLTNAWSESLFPNCKVKKKEQLNSTDDGLFNRPELHCLIKLEEWNEVAPNDQSTHDTLEKILHEMGRFDLAAHLSEKLYSMDRLKSTDNFITE